MSAHWRIAARSADALPADWRERLAARPGVNLRRIGAYAERVLAGALECLDGMALPAHGLIRLASGTGAVGAMDALARQSRAGEPLMPFTFLQSLPTQALSLLARQLAWRGDAIFHLHGDMRAVMELALCEAGMRPLLFGWVDEPAVSRWWYCEPELALPGDAPWVALAPGRALPIAAVRLRLGARGLEWA